MTNRAAVDASLLPVVESFERQNDRISELFREVTKLPPEAAIGSLISRQFTLDDVNRRFVTDAMDEVRYAQDTASASKVPDFVRSAYAARGDEVIARGEFILASDEADMPGLDSVNQYLYGPVEDEVAAAVADYYRGMAGEIEDGPHSAYLAAQTVQTGLKVNEAVSRRELRPGAELFEQVRTDHFRPGGFFDQVLDGIPLDLETYTQDNSLPYVERILENIGAGNYILVPTGNTTWSVNNHKKHVNHPRQFSMPVERFVGLPAGHEIASHILEFINGSNGPLLLTRFGLDRHIRGSEGRPVVREEIAYATHTAFEQTPRWHMILERQLAVALGAGAAGFERHGIVETFEVIRAIDTVRAAHRGRTLDSGELQRIDKQAWSLAAKTALGTDGQGGAYYRDKAYLEGSLVVWATEAELPGSIADGDRGKYDITNPRHRDILAQAYAIS